MQTLHPTPDSGILAGVSDLFVLGNVTLFFSMLGEVVVILDCMFSQPKIYFTQLIKLKLSNIMTVGIMAVNAEVEKSN